jgi:RNA polymerase sigma-70 factor (ECF subfamily)
MTRADFKDLVSMHSRKLFGHAFRILKNREEAEDAVQEVFIRLWNMERKLEEYNSVEALAVTMTKNYCIDQLRKPRFINNENPGINSVSGKIEISPHDQMERKETSDIINEIIGRLPVNYRIIIQMREIEGFSYEEISKKTHMNINALRVTLSRARKIIRDEYIKHQDEYRRT